MNEGRLAGKAIWISLAILIFSLISTHPSHSRENYTDDTISLTIWNKNEDILKGTGLRTSSNTGSASFTHPIYTPRGRGGLTPSLFLLYNSSNGLGISGRGWRLSLPSISRNIKNGLDYDASDFVFKNGDTVDELAPRPDWGEYYYGRKIESAHTNFSFNPLIGFLAKRSHVLIRANW